MNRWERVIDDTRPDLGVRLRAIKLRWRRDFTRRIIENVVRPGDVVVDVGANRGVYTYLLSTQVGPSGRVHAVEPVPALGHRLRAMARQCGNVTVHPVGLSDQAGTMALHVPVFDGHQVDALATLGEMTAVPSISLDVRIRTLDGLLAAESGRISFLKCDVEGHEHHVLQGGTEILRRHRPVVVVEIEQRHRADPIETTFTLMRDLGYCCFCVTPHGLRHLATFDVRRDQTAHVTDDFVPYGMPAEYINDFLFLPPGMSRPDRLAMAAPPARD